MVDQAKIELQSLTEHGSVQVIPSHCIGTGRRAPHTGAESTLPCCLLPPSCNTVRVYSSINTANRFGNYYQNLSPQTIRRCGRRRPLRGNQHGEKNYKLIYEGMAGSAYY